MGERPVQFSSLLIERPKLERAILDSRHRNDFGIVSRRENLIRLLEILIDKSLLDHGDTAFAQKPTEAGGNKSLCQENATEKLSSDCTPGKAYTPRSVQAVNERPAISAVPIGRDGPALLSSERATPVAATPDGPDGFAKQADAGPAMDAAPASAVVESPTRAASVEKARTRSSQVHRRDRNGYSSSPRYSSHSYYQSGYARVY